MDEFVIVKDTRERKGLDFNLYVENFKLDVGDYSIKGLEHILFIERKGCLAEFYQNCIQKRFWKELDRAKEHKYKYLILEFSLSDIENLPYSLNLPKKIWAKMKISPKYIMSCVSRIQYDYEVIVLFVENREKSKQVMLDIMSRIHAS
jgi:ERCC4-type nuclease